MSEQPASRSSRVAAAPTLRVERLDDDPFLFEVYSGTRREELAVTGWDAATRTAFLQMQFRAMRRGYASMFPAADFMIVLLDGKPMGRMVVNRTAGEIHLVDMALLTADQGKGIGTCLMRDLLAEATRTQKRIRLQVLKNNRATRFYERLGFRRFEEAGPYEQMEWRPGG